MNPRLHAELLALLFPLCSCAAPAPNTAPASVAAQAPGHHAIATDTLEPHSCGTIERLHTCGGIFLASQPAAADFQLAKDAGMQTVLDLRKPDEGRGFDEPRIVRELGLAYVNLPFGSPDELTDEVFARGRELLARAQRPLLVHCHSSNRVGAIWLAWRALDGGLSWEAALAEARTVGLKTPALEAKARDYVERQRAAPR